MSNDKMKDWSQAKEAADLNNLPQYKTSSKLFLGSTSAPTARLDLGHSTHNKAPHLHLGTEKGVPPLKLSPKDAINTYAEMVTREMVSNATYKVSGSDG